MSVISWEFPHAARGEICLCQTSFANTTWWAVDNDPKNSILYTGDAGELRGQGTIDYDDGDRPKAADGHDENENDKSIVSLSATIVTNKKEWFEPHYIGTQRIKNKE